MSEILYQKNGDYMIPNLTLEETMSQQTLTKYGRMRKQYLLSHRPILYNRLVLTGQLQSHLLEIQETANRRLEQMIREMAQESGVTEELKATDQMKWVGLMNTLKAQAEEMILEELIFA